MKIIHQHTTTKKQAKASTFFSPATIQRKLTIGQPNDKYEQEADAMADKVMRMPQNGIQRDCEKDKGVQTKPMIQRECTAGSWKKEYDGCSLPSWLSSSLGIDKDNPAGGSDTHFANMKPSSRGGKACDRHDECYQTCNPSTLAKDMCDAKMYQDMLTTCLSSSESLAVKLECMNWADLYYKGLQVGGLPAFVERQWDVCRC